MLSSAILSLCLGCSGLPTHGNTDYTIMTPQSDMSLKQDGDVVVLKGWLSGIGDFSVHPTYEDLKAGNIDQCISGRFGYDFRDKYSVEIPSYQGREIVLKGNLRKPALMQIGDDDIFLAHNGANACDSKYLLDPIQIIN